MRKKYGETGAAIQALVEEFGEQQFEVIQSLYTHDTAKLKGKLRQAVDIALGAVKAAEDLPAREKGKYLGIALWIAIEGVALEGAGEVTKLRFS